MNSSRSRWLWVLCLIGLLLAGTAVASPAGAGEWQKRRTLTRVKNFGKKVKRSVAGGFRTLHGNVREHMRSHDDGELDDSELKGLLRRLGIRRNRRGGTVVQDFPVDAYEGGWHWPLEAGVVSSEFGPRHGREHRGLDIAAQQGVPVLSAAAGQVIYSGSGLEGYGRVVIVRHDQQTTTLYAHNQRNLARVGDQVEAGDEIAKLGSTGRSTGPHVHFEIRVEDRAIDPRQRLPR